jgi:hypothetical protein
MQRHSYSQCPGQESKNCFRKSLIDFLVMYEAAMPTEAWLPLHCFVSTDCFSDWYHMTSLTTSVSRMLFSYCFCHTSVISWISHCFYILPIDEFCPKLKPCAHLHAYTQWGSQAFGPRGEYSHCPLLTEIMELKISISWIYFCVAQKFKIWCAQKGEIF